VEIISLLVSTLAVFLRKCKLVSIKCRSHKNFKGPLKLKRELAGACKNLTFLSTLPISLSFVYSSFIDKKGLQYK
jgi:hypothetical protein